MKTKIIVSFTILLLFTNIGRSQNAKLNIHYKSFRPISESLAGYSNGSGFTFIVVQKVKKDKILIHDIQSTNSVTNLKLHELFKKNNFDSVFIEFKKGYYCLPIFQCYYNLENELIWTNNNKDNIEYFVKQFKLPNNTQILNPVVLFSREGIR